jgi:hypothetical protein
MKLTQQTLKTLFTYDGTNLRWKAPRVNSVKVGDRFGYVDSSSDGYIRGKIFDQMQREHRLVWLFVTGSWPQDQLDHIDGNPTNNAITNLREVSTTENQKNKSLRVDNTSGVPGVFWYTRLRKWQATIGVNNQRIVLGRYENWFDAVCARKSAEVLYGFHPNHGRCQ